MKNKKMTLTRLIQLKSKQAKTRGYTYFVSGNPTIGYSFTLVDRDGNTLCSSAVYASTAEVLKTLRTVQRHAATTDTADEAQQPGLRQH